MKKLLEKIRKILRDRRTRRFLTRFVSGLGAIVVFVTTYALVLPAITMELEANCGLEAHQHNDSCYEKVLTCTIPESPGHTHTDACYQVDYELTCRTEEHSHDSSCYDEDGNLTCALTEHTHIDDCYKETRNLVCGLEESKGHQHDESCYEKILTCGKEVHVHSTACYENDPAEESAVAASTSSAGVASGASAVSAGASAGTGAVSVIEDDDNNAEDDGSDAGNGLDYGNENAGTGMTESAAMGVTLTDNAQDSYIPPLDPVNVPSVLDKSTSIYFHRVAEDEIVEDSTALTYDQWERIDKNTELGKNDLLRVYLAYTIPAGSLNATNPVARYRLPGNLHLTDAQVKAINENVNGIAGQYVNYDSLEITDTEKYNAYLGIEAVEGNRKPTDDPDKYLRDLVRSGNEGSEYISAVVRVENVYDVDGINGDKDAYLGQDLIFTFTPYSIEKNQHEYDASGQPTKAGEEIYGWIAFDITAEQIVWNQDDAEENDARTAEIVFAEKDKELGIHKISTELKLVNTAEDTSEEGKEDEPVLTDNDSDKPENADDSSTTAATVDPDKSDENESNQGDNTENDQVDDADNSAEEAAQAGTEESASAAENISYPAVSFDDSITVIAGSLSTDTKENSDSANTNNNRSTKIAVHVEADIDTFPEGTAMVLSAVSDDQMTTVAEAVEGAVDAPRTMGFHAVDISFRDTNGNEIEPLKPIKVSMTSDAIQRAVEDESTAPVVVHVEDGGPHTTETEDSSPDSSDSSEESNAAEKKDSGETEKAEAPTAAIIEANAESSDTSHGSTDDTLTFEAGSFSVYAIVYTVDFHYEVNGKMYNFNIPGGGFVSLEHVVEVLHIASVDEKSENGSENAENGTENENDLELEVPGVEEVAENEEGSSEETADDEANPSTEGTTYEEAIKLNEMEVSEAARKFVADVEDVEFSSPKLMWVGKIDEAATVGWLKDANRLQIVYSAELTEEQISEINAQRVEAGDWALISVQSFTSEESLTVTMKNGNQFVIRVTDAQRIGNQLNGKSYVIKNQKSQAYAMTAPGFEYAGQNYMTSAAVTDTNNQIWTFEYSNNYGGSYKLKSALNGKYLTINGDNGKGLTLSDNGSYFYVEEGNGEYSIYYIKDNQKYYINFYDDGGTGKNYTLNTENEISHNSTHHDITFILKELEPSLNVPSNNWLLYLDEDKTEITINKGDTLTLRPYGEWYWKNDDQPSDLRNGEWTFDSASWDTTKNYNEYVSAANKSITYFSKATARNGTIEFTGYPKWDSEVKELYPVLHGKATGVGDFVLKTTKGKTITVHVVESGAEHPVVVQKTEKIKVNLFDYDKNGVLDPSDSKKNVVGNLDYSNINKDSYSNDLKFLSSGGGQAQNNPAPINAYTNQDANQGIVDGALILDNSDGKYYPRLASQFGYDSLKYLFNTNQKTWTNDGAMIAYPDVEGLFQKDSQGYYFFNSNSNYAYYNGSKVVLYDHTYTQQTGNTGKENAKPIGFFPFHQYDPTHDLIVNNNKNLNHHLGMSMQVDFILPSDKKNNGEPIIFEFTGDDDLWVFVDNRLVLDIGGIHQPVRGYIDFTNGKVYVYDKDGGTLLKEDSFVKNLSVNQTHKLDMFYLERGGCDSNLAVRFNLLIVEDFTLEKKLAGLTETERQKYKNKEFLYDVYVNDTLYSGSGAIRKNAAGQQIGDAFSVTNGRVVLKDGETVTITGLSPTDRVNVVERSLNMDQFEDPTAKRYYPSETDNEQVEEVISLTKSQSQNAAATINDWGTQTYNLDKAEKITYTNTLKEKDLEVEKQWVGDKDHPDEISFTVGASVEKDDDEMIPYTVSSLKKENGTDDKVFTLSNENDWKTFIYHLPVATPEGKPIVYSVREAEVEGYISASVDITDEAYNYYTVDVVKIWPDETTHNEVINIRLKNSDGKYFSGSYNNKGEAVFVDNASEAGTFQLSRQNNFTLHFDLLSAGKTYTVELADGEEELSQGLVTYTRSVIQYRLINTPIGSQVDPEGPQDNPEIHKRIDALRDGATNPDSPHQGEDLTDLYRLYLDYKVNSLQEAEGVDLLFVIDHSGSMNSNYYQGNRHRAPSVMQALNGENGVIADFLKMGETEDGDNKNRWAAVGFKGPYGRNYVSLWGDSGYRSPNAGENDSEILSGNDYSWRTNRTDINLPLGNTALMYDPRYGWIPYGSTVLTDYTAGFWRAEQFLLQDAIKNDKKKKVIVFISDGIPTLHIPGLDDAQSLVGADEKAGSPYYPDDSGGCPEQAKTQFGYFVNDMKNIGGYEFGKDIEIYTIGFGGSMSSGTQGETLLKEMLTIAYGNNSHAGTNYMAINDINPNGNYTTTASDKLKEDLRTVLGMNEKFTNIVIQDDLSRYVDLYGLASLAHNASVSDIMKAAKAKVTMTIPDPNNSGQSRAVVLYENGASGTGSEARFTKTTGNSTSTVPIVSGLEYNSDTKTIKVVFDPDYEAVEGVTYTLSFDVRTTDEAYSTYADSGYDKYPAGDEHEGQVIKGDVDTDFLETDPDNATSVNKPGFRSNDGAKATYHHNEKPEEKEYLHPVIQVAATIDIVKVDELGGALEGAKFNLYGKDYDSSKTLDQNRTCLIQENLQSKIPTNPAGKDAVIRNGRLGVGTYYLVETKAPDGYYSLSAPVKITVKQENTEGILSVTAEIGGAPMGDRLQKVEGKNGSWKLTISNSAGYELPATGGSGTKALYLLGFMLASFAGVGLVMGKRRRGAA